uniref:Uncharacterized protein n=1 Tax=Knipowitschia caucasica TaxID=637954 RepID=A0AAV2K1M4_KNICA
MFHTGPKREEPNAPKPLSCFLIGSSLFSSAFALTEGREVSEEAAGLSGADPDLQRTELQSIVCPGSHPTLVPRHLPKMVAPLFGSCGGLTDGLKLTQRDFDS